RMEDGGWHCRARCYAISDLPSAIPIYTRACLQTLVTFALGSDPAGSKSASERLCKHALARQKFLSGSSVVRRMLLLRTTHHTLSNPIRTSTDVYYGIFSSCPGRSLSASSAERRLAFRRSATLTLKRSAILRSVSPS